MKHLKRKLITLLTAACMFCAMGVPVFGAGSADASKLGNPQKASNRIVTWSCVWFGHYPQSSNGKGGFKNEPIKWRVLSVNGDEALLLADKSLDCKPYNENSYTGVTWELSTVRSWLNGYDVGFNEDGKDYTSENFIKKAFSAVERQAIKEKIIHNPDNSCDNTEGGNDTADKIFFLSIDEIQEPAYGFLSNDIYSKTRRALNTEYAKAQGANTYTYTNSEYTGNGDWWLRSPGSNSRKAARVNTLGEIDRRGFDVNDVDVAVRPALFLNLNSTSWSYAGTVLSNGAKKEENGPDKSGAAVKPKTVALKKVSSPKKKQLKLTWKKDTKATGYQAVVATDKKFKKNKKTATIKKNKTVTKTFKNLKSKKTYFAKVRAYKKAGKKNIYGAYSKVKKVKVK